MEGKFELQFEDGEYYLVDSNSNDTVATTDKVLLKEYDGYMKKLSLKNCEAIANGYDLEELAEELTGQYATLNPKSFKRGVLYGFQKALEILHDNKFSEDDMRKAINWSWRKTDREEHILITDEKDFIQSLQQTEWDVEIEMEKEVGTKLHDDGREFFMIDGTKPKLDAENCLILKRK